MFKFCRSLKELDISQFNFDKVKNKENMFSSCDNELKIKVRPQNYNSSDNLFFCCIF